MSHGCDPIDLAIQVSLREVHRYLGYRHPSRPNQRVGHRLEVLWDSAHHLLTPRGSCRVISGREAAAAGMPRPSDTVGIGLCTIGPALEEEVRRLTERGDLLDAMILDAYGSAAAEAAADALNQELVELVKPLGFTTQRRVSPGYGKWDVACQDRFLALLPAQDLGVRLTPGCMMIPRKSVSFAVRCLTTGIRASPTSAGCEGCEVEPCLFRDQDPQQGKIERA